MWTESSISRELIEEISKNVVVEVAPEEEDMFDELMGEYFQNPTPPDLSAKPKDDPLAFGVNEMLFAITPAVAAMVDAVLNHVATEFIKAAKGESKESIKKIVKKLFSNDSKDIKPLDKEQLEQVKKLAKKQAIKFGIQPDKAENMAIALIGSLALS